MKKTLTIALLLLAATAIAKPKDYTVSSPNGILSAKVTVDKDIRYTLTSGPTLLIDNSAISMTMTDGVVFGLDD